MDDIAKIIGYLMIGLVLLVLLATITGALVANPLSLLILGMSTIAIIKKLK